MAEGWNGRGRESFPSRLPALTIVRIARYRSSPRFIVGEIYVKCIEGLGHFYSIEIMSTSQLLCSPAQTILSRTASYRELSNNSPSPSLPDLFLLLLPRRGFPSQGEARCHASMYPEHRLPHTIIASSKQFFLFSRPPPPFSSPLLIKIHPEFSHETLVVYTEKLCRRIERKKGTRD